MNDKSINQQPVYVLAAVIIHSDIIYDVYENIREKVASLKIENIWHEDLGKGFEIKAKDVDHGRKYWKNKNKERHQIREIFINSSDDIIYILVFIDKKKHKRRYNHPDDPSCLALKFILERVQGFLSEKSEKGMVIVDSNQSEISRLLRQIRELLQIGSIGYRSDIKPGWKLEMNNIIEIHFGNSKYSLGIQIADFVARHAYSWWKKGKAPIYPAWKHIETKLYKYPNHEGWGYKEFPGDD